MARRNIFKLKKKDKKQLDYPLRKDTTNLRGPQTVEEFKKYSDDPYIIYKKFYRPKGHALMTREQFNEEVAKHKAEVNSIMSKEEQEKLKDLQTKAFMEGRATSIDKLVDSTHSQEKKIADRYRKKLMKEGEDEYEGMPEFTEPDEPSEKEEE
jgi:hypothetical protein